MPLHPGGISPVDPTGSPVAPSLLYGLKVNAAGRIEGLEEAATPGGGGVVTYAQTNKTHIIARTDTGGNTWNRQSWPVSHDWYMRLLSFTCDIVTADTYTLSIDGRDVASTVCASASTGNVFTPGIFAGVGSSTPLEIPPGTHTWSIRGTAARAFYYSNVRGALATGTYPNLNRLLWGHLMGATVTATFHGTVTADFEGV